MIWIQLSPVLLLLLLLLRLANGDADAPCYLPNGGRAPDHLVCNPTAYIASCCPYGWTCYSNSMCVVTDPATANSTHPIGSSMRGSCTNPQWNNAICGDFCLSDRDVGGDLTACGDDNFCCADDPGCSCAKGAFHISPGVVQTIIGVQGLANTQTSSFATSATSAPSSRISASTTAAPTSPSAAAGHARPLDKPGAKVGVALGVILGVGLLGFAAFLVYRHFILPRRRSSRAQRPVEPTTPAGPDPIDDPYVPGNPASFIPPIPETYGLGPSASFIPPIPQMTQRSEDIRDIGDAPFDNAYERNTPSRTGVSRPPTTADTGLLNGTYNGTQQPGGRPMSFVSDESERFIVDPRASELG